jgi:hypothetical protein
MKHVWGKLQESNALGSAGGGRASAKKWPIVNSSSYTSINLKKTVTKFEGKKSISRTAELM